MQRKSLDIWVGLFIVMGAAALMFLALKAGNLGSVSFGKTYQVTARFDNIGSLRPQAAVKASGVVVGRVAAGRRWPHRLGSVLPSDRRRQHFVDGR